MKKQHTLEKQNGRGVQSGGTTFSHHPGWRFPHKNHDPARH